MYGKYKSIDEIRNLVAPSKARVNRVISYFRTAGFTGIELTRSGDFLHIHATPTVANAALQTEIVQWTHSDFARPVFRSVVPYSLPSALSNHIDFISGIHHFPIRKQAIFGSPASQTAVGPMDLRTRYNVTDTYTGSVK